AVRWRYYLGGSLQPGQFLAADVNGDRRGEVVYVQGGRVVVKQADDALVWSSDLLGIYGLGDVFDINGDGTVDVIALAPGRIVILSGADGRLEWSSPAGVFGQ